MIIKVKFRWDNRVGTQLIFIHDFLKKFPFEDQDVSIDFAALSYVPPLISTFFSSFLEKFNYVKIIGISEGSYHANIRFPTGLKPENEDDWELKMKYYATKNYLPLIHFNNSKTTSLTKQREGVISQSCRIIRQVADMPSNIYNGFMYMVSELSDNIVEHSKSERGWFSYQYYPSDNFIDLCISDSGIGLLQAYKNYSGTQDFSSITTHLKALESVIKGFSTKSNERGFGVHTSREMLIKGLGGKFVMLSGNALLFNYTLTDFKVEIFGSLILIRIPSNTFDKNFSYQDFVE
ncbi:MAG: ATP-binding protein [Cytophagales bacterium]